MLGDLFDSAMDRPSDFHVIVKCHPETLKVPGFVTSVQDLLGEYGTVSAELLLGPVSLHEYIALADALVLTGGTTALEAMVLGCPSVVYVNESQFSHNPMTEYPDAVILVAGREDMKRALTLISDEEMIEKVQPAWGRPLRDMFFDTRENPSARFLNVVRKQWHIAC